MGFWGELLFGEKDRKPVLVNLPTPLVFATETLVYLLNSQNHKQIQFDNIVSYALNEYLGKHLYTDIENDNVVEFTPPPSTINREIYTKGRTQSKSK